MTQDGFVHAVNGVSFNLKKGELLGVVGESGSGKSVTMLSLLKLLPMPPADIVAGKAKFEKNDVGASHIAFLVNDIDSFYANAKDKGLKPVNPPASLHDENGTLLRQALYAQDPDGNWIELVELF